jgi:hypothetical protein
MWPGFSATIRFRNLSAMPKIGPFSARNVQGHTPTQNHIETPVERECGVSFSLKRVSNRFQSKKHACSSH